MSVIIPCHNCAATLERAIRSVVVQTVRPAEVILIDDASVDDSRRTIEIVQSRYGNEWIRSICLETNCGPGVARNTGWEVATQPYIAFLDADDAWHPRKIEIQYGWMEAHQEVGLSGHACPVHTHGVSMVDDVAPRARSLHVVQFLISNRFSTPTVMLRRDLPYRFEGGKRFAEDYLLWLQIILDRVPITYLDAPLAVIFKRAYGDAGLSARLWEMEKGELAVFWTLAKERRLAMPVALACMGYSILKYMRRVLIVALRQLRRVQP